MVKRIILLIACLFGHHDWTCAAHENIPPTEEQLTSGMDGFNDYAKMYCKRCKKLYPGGKSWT